MCSATSTRTMLKAPLSVPEKSRSPPDVFTQREKPLYRNSNPFSDHDNRHSIQGRAEYLGNGCDTRLLGRRLHPIDRRIHRTDVTFLHHKRPSAQNGYSSITATSYRDPGLLEPLTHRRFPKMYGGSELSQSTTETLRRSDSPFRTPLHVLAMSQQPFPRSNNWKYSYHGDYKVYPPYNRSKSTALKNPRSGCAQQFNGTL